jgi:hypothetical protein
MSAEHALCSVAIQAEPKMLSFTAQINGQNYLVTPMIRLMKQADGSMSLQQALQRLSPKDEQNGKGAELTWFDVPVVEPKSNIITMPFQK